MVGSCAHYLQGVRSSVQVSPLTSLTEAPVCCAHNRSGSTDHMGSLPRHSKGQVTTMSSVFRCRK